MFKRMTKKCLSLLLALCIVMSLVTVGVVSASAKDDSSAAGERKPADLAATGNPLVEFAIDKALDTAMRVDAKMMDATAIQRYLAVCNDGYDIGEPSS